MTFKKISSVIIACLAIFLFGCQKKDSEQKNVDINSSTNQTALNNSTGEVLTQNYDSPFNIELNNGDILTLTKTKEGFNIDNTQMPVLFVFFTTECKPCDIAIDVLNDIQLKYSDQLLVVGIVLNEISKEKLDEFIDSKSIQFPINNTQESNFFAKAVGDVKNIPYMILYDDKGKELRRYEGIIPEEMLENDLLRFVK